MCSIFFPYTLIPSVPARPPVAVIMVGTNDLSYAHPAGMLRRERKYLSVNISVEKGKIHRCLAIGISAILLLQCVLVVPFSGCLAYSPIRMFLVNGMSLSCSLVHFEHTHFKSHHTLPTRVAVGATRWTKYFSPNRIWLE